MTGLKEALDIAEVVLSQADRHDEYDTISAALAEQGPRLLTNGTFPPCSERKPMNTALPSAKEVNPLTACKSRRFALIRNDDETGISGTGMVAEGIEFSTGWCALSWMTSAHSVGIYPNIKELERIHGHNGRAIVEWLT